MTVKIGCGKNAIDWDPAAVISPHILLLGKTGTGKSHQLRELVTKLGVSGIPRLHVFDVHGDLETPNESYVSFKQSAGYGINPLLINDDKDWGGIRRRISTIIDTLNWTNRQLGSKQEVVLRCLLNDLFAANQYYENDPSSWTIGTKRIPALRDAILFGKAKLQALYTYTEGPAAEALQIVNRTAKRIYTLKTKSRGTPSDEELDTLLKHKATAIDAYTDYVTSIDSGRELENIMRYDSTEVLKGVIDRLETLEATGVFTAKRPPFDPNAPVWRYDIHTMPAPQRTFFINIRAQQLFERARQRGPCDRVNEFIVLDEAHALGAANDSEHPVNKIAIEARKFGLGLLAASQATTHFSQDFLSSMGTKVLLGIDPIYQSDVSRKLQVPVQHLRNIQFQSTALVRVETKVASRHDFQEIALR